MPITRNQLYALSARAQVDHETARKWLNPDYRPRMKPVTEARIAKAAAELGMQIPQKEMAKSA